MLDTPEQYGYSRSSPQQLIPLRCIFFYPL